MKPFSPLYFIKENKAKCILLMFMLFLGYAAYLGGLYVKNPRDNWNMTIEYIDKRFVQIYPTEDIEKFQKFCKEIEDSGKAKVIKEGTYSGLPWTTILGFTMGNSAQTFRSTEDFKTYCEYMDIKCDFSKVKSGSLILSDIFAKNLGLKVGDKIDKNYSSGINGSFTLTAITNESGFFSYFITDEKDKSGIALLLPENGASRNEVFELAQSLGEKYGVNVAKVEEELSPQFRSFDIMFIFIVVLMAVIMAVTINAAFVGMYQRRNFEFAVYRAIGISKKSIIGKIAGELLMMDLFAITIGGGLFFLILYLLNNLALYPNGKYLSYFNPTALFGFLLCNLLVIIPLIITRCRQMLKADICEY